MKKIIVLYSTGGMGHKKAAEAVFNVLKGRKGVECKNIDTLDYGTKFYKFAYMDSYVFFMTKAKLFWGLLYYLFNNRMIDFITRKLRLILDLKNLKGLDSMLIKERPDAVISTHFVLSGIASHLKSAKGFKARLYTVVTDYGPHAFWKSVAIDRYFIGADKTVAENFVREGFPRDKITVAGMPIDAKFSKNYDTAKIKSEFGLIEGKKTILILSGGFGVGPIEAMLKSLVMSKSDFQVITVCGHNKKLFDDIDTLKNRLNYSLKLFAFTDRVAELMSVSDILITKAGGISVTEAINMRLPMILIGSIPGQESWNEQFLLNSEAGVKVKDVEKLAVEVDRILGSKEVYNELKRNIERIRYPNAASNIVDIVLKDIDI